MVDNSCDLQNKNRFRCSSQNKCIQSWLVLNGIRDCINGEDEFEYNRRGRHVLVAFTYICDGFIDSVMTTDNGHVETNETNCEDWQCDNHYTHCNGVWNCANGADEIACERFRCAPNEHPCISSRTYKPICLPLPQAGNDQIDCLGSFDERSYCRKRQPMMPQERYRCQNDRECTRARLVCRFLEYCPNEDRQGICRTVVAGEESLVKLHDENRLQIFFSLSSSNASDENMASTSHHSIISNPSQTWNDESIESQIVRGLNDVYYHRAWLCNRGIPIYNHWQHEDACLCPPGHYGNHCQYRNQRVSLTIRFNKENAPHLWHALFYFSIMLIDEEQHVHSYDYITYVPTRDCVNKFLRPSHICFDELVTYVNDFLAKIVIIPVKGNVASPSCLIKCNHGRCFKYENIDKHFCRCDAGWYGQYCQEMSVNQCSSDSIFYGIYNNRSICVCPFGPRCLLTRSVCQSNVCQYGGLRIPDDERVSQNGFTCLCSSGFSGNTCADANIKINIYFDDIPISSASLVHFITVHSAAEPTQTKIVKNVPADKKSVEFYAPVKFNLLFIEIPSFFYLAILKHTHTPA
ncbi:unnamed protein product [Rotaria sp. Silwood2]|nr:unnamed protein product [Rotaria sp. Silwood2]